MSNFCSARPENQWWRQLEVRFYSRSSIIHGDQVGYSSGGRTINYILQLRSYDFKEVFLVLWIKRFLLEKIVHFKCGYLSGSNHLNLHWKLNFSTIYNMHHFKILCPSGLHCSPSCDTKRSNFFSHSFWRYNFEKLNWTMGKTSGPTTKATGCQVLL